MGNWIGDDNFTEEDHTDNVGQLREYLNLEALVQAAKTDLEYYRETDPEMAKEFTIADLVKEQLRAVREALNDDVAIERLTQELDK